MSQGRSSVGVSAVVQPKARRFPFSLFTRRNLTGYAFVGPWLFGFLVFTFFPFLASLGLSLTRWDLVNPPEFIGVRHFVRMFTDDKLWRITIFNTFYYSAFSVPGIQVLGLLLAVVLNQKVRGMPIYRTLFYLPAITPGIASAFLWMQLFNPRIGMINNLLSKVGIAGPNWLYDMKWSMPALIVMSLWGCGGAMVIYLAGLQGVPTHLYEAAEVDGATSWHKFWKVTLPLITPTMFFNLVMGIINSFQVFTSAFIMTGGGPANRTMFYTLYLFNQAFYDFRMGYASAMAWMLFIIVLILTLIQLALSQRWVYYEGAVRGRGVI